MPAAPWYVDAFTSAYLEVYAHRDDASAEREARGALNLLRLRPGAGRLLDLAAGAGRHARAFRLDRVDVTCLDLSEDLTRRSQALGLPTVRGDLRALPFLDGSFAAITCLFSSFGYFEAEEEHLQALREVARLLQPGGAALLDLMDRDTVRFQLQPQSVDVADGRIVSVERALLDGAQRVIKQVRLTRDGSASQTWTESVRLFTGEELQALATHAGLALEATWGDYDGRAHRPGETRRIVLMRKPRLEAGQA
ncbi:MAG: class I SAM-dependent methyltransferase [Planctomycetota bacterium]